MSHPSCLSSQALALAPGQGHPRSSPRSPAPCCWMHQSPHPRHGRGEPLGWQQPVCAPGAVPVAGGCQRSPGASLPGALCGGHGSADHDALGARTEATLRSLPDCPFCRHGSTHWPQLRLALDQLHVLSSGKGEAGDVAEDGEDSSYTNSLVLIWPCGSCIVTFW